MVYINPAYTSQRCSVCGFISKKNRNRANFTCIRCGFNLNSDLNSSRNIESKYFNDEYIMNELALKAKAF